MNSQVAQSANDLVGTWRPVSVTNTRPDGSTALPFGPNPKGILVFHQNGHFAFILNRALHRTLHQRRCACWFRAGEGSR